MEDIDPNMLYKAIEIFKKRYGIKEPLTTEGMDKIIKELKEKGEKKK